MRPSVLIGVLAIHAAWAQFVGFCNDQSTGTSNAYHCSVTPSPGSYSRGMLVEFRAAFGNTGPATFTLNGIKAAPIVKAVSIPLGPGDIQQFENVLVTYDGAVFQLLNPVPVFPPPAASIGLSVIRTSSTTLVVGSECTTTAPCRTVFNTIPIWFTSPSTITYQSGVGNLRVYAAMTPDGIGYLGVAPDNAALLVSCDTCVVNQPPAPNLPVTVFSIGSIPLAEWSITTPGQLDTTGLDFRSVLRNSYTQIGLGLETIQSPSSVVPQLMVNQGVIPVLSPVPASASSSCEPPQLAIDPVAALLYWCAAPNTWLRAQLMTF